MAPPAVTTLTGSGATVVDSEMASPKAPTTCARDREPTVASVTMASRSTPVKPWSRAPESILTRVAAGTFTVLKAWPTPTNPPA